MEHKNTEVSESAPPVTLKHFWFPLLVFAVSLAVTLTLWLTVDRSVTGHAETRFNNETETVIQRIIKRMHDDEQVLRGGNALFGVMGDRLCRQDWQHYVTALKFEQNYPGILGIGFSIWLTPQQKEANIRSVRAEGFPDYRIRPEGPRPAYTSIIWLEPFDWRNQRALGFDMYSEPVRRAAMDKARDSGTTTIAARVVLVQETDRDKQSGMLMYVPSYRAGMPTTTIEQRRAALRGFVYSPIRMNDFVYGSLNSLPKDMDFQIYAGAAPSADNLMFSSQVAEKHSVPDGYRPMFATVKTVEAYGASWHFSFKTMPAFDGELNRSKAQAVLVAGITASILLSLLAFLQAKSRRQALTIADQMALQLSAQEALSDSEERFRTIVESSPMAMYFYRLDPDGELILTDANPAADRMTGTSNKTLLNKRIEDAFPGLKTTGIPDMYRKVASGELDTQTFEVSYSEGGINGTFEVKVYRYTPGFISVDFIDISDRKLAEEERLKIERQLLHAQKLESLGVLAGGIAHDFNNILMAIIGNADLALMRINKESPATENLHRIEQAASRAADLAKQMLAYSGKGKFVIENIDLNLLLEEMLHMLEVSISKKAVLRFNLHQPLPSVEADATQMRQIIMNLVINASEAIGDKSGVIAITTGCMDCDRNYLKDVWLDENISAGLYVYLEIADTGCGMDKAIMAKLFDPFFTTKFTGRGLGMAAVLGIVRGHKGAIKVYSEPNKGTSFKILLPASERPAELFNGNTGGDDDWKGSGKVLLVDDEETVRGIGREMLQELGFDVVTACDGREAVEAFKQLPDTVFVILDLTMPHMDGEQCFRELRQIKPDIKVIMSSGYNEQEVTQKFVGKGLAGFIQKPYRLTLLRDEVRKVLHIS